MPDVKDLIPLVALSIPVIAIVGGITSGILKTMGKQRLLELAQRERIAAIERGLDPAKLPPHPLDVENESYDHAYSHARNPARHAQNLMIGGIVTLAVGISMGIFLRIAVTNDPAWAVGLIPTGVGLALILSSILVRPKNGRPGGNPPAV
jgi:hypothetical protein